MSATKDIILVRHGECESNATEIFQAGNQYANDPLTKKGQSQARNVAKRFSNVKLDVIISSSYLRARQTAMTIQKATGVKIVVPVIVKNKVFNKDISDPKLGTYKSLLREIDVPSELEGRTFTDEIVSRIQQASEAHTYDDDWHYSDEENLYDLWERAELITDYLINRPEKTIAVIGHGGTFKVLLGHMLFERDHLLAPKQKLVAYRAFSSFAWYDNTGVVSLRYRSQAGWQLLLANNEHLKPKYFHFMPEKSQQSTSLALVSGASNFLGEIWPPKVWDRFIDDIKESYKSTRNRFPK